MVGRTEYGSNAGRHRYALPHTTLPARCGLPAPRRRYITAIDPVSSVPVRCIQVDSPSQLYLAGRKMVPTHNTTLCLTAVVWAILSGQHKFVFLIAAAQEAALSLLASIKSHLAGNALLLADYPEAIYPIRCLENEARRCTGQRYYGIPTQIKWGIDEIVMPTIPGSRCSGAIIRVSGITGHIRGALYVRADGQQERPSLAICDDPQTDESARSTGPTGQTAQRLAIIKGAVQGLAGPGLRTGVIVPCTVIYPDDLADKLLDREENPSWHGERTKLLYQFPADEKLWAEYARIRDESLRADGDGHEATHFYAANREAMDAGSIVAWPARFDRGELSALQHAINLKLDRGEHAFFSEYQNEPLPAEEADGEMLTADQIAAKTNGLGRGIVPIGADHLAAFIDVQGKLLFYVVTAWAEDFTGYVIDYGTWPDQKRPVFSLRDARRTLALATKNANLEGAIYAGLTALTDELLIREWRRDDGAMMRIGRCLIDANWGDSTDVVYQFCRQSAHSAVLMPSHGRYVGASGVSFAEYKRRPGERVGHHWRIPNVQGRRQVRHVLIDTNYWKSFVHARLAVPMGDPGCLSLFGRAGAGAGAGRRPAGLEGSHELFAEHLTSEYKVTVEARGKTVDEWKPRPEKPDNHWLDCLVGCAVGAAMAGCSITGMSPVPAPRDRGRAIKLSELQGRSSR